MERKQLSNRIRMYYTSHSIVSGYTQKTKQRRVDVIVEREKVLESHPHHLWWLIQECQYTLGSRGCRRRGLHLCLPESSYANCL